MKNNIVHINTKSNSTLNDGENRSNKFSRQALADRTKKNIYEPEHEQVNILRKKVYEENGLKRLRENAKNKQRQFTHMWRLIAADSISFDTVRWKCGNKQQQKRRFSTKHPECAYKMVCGMNNVIFRFRAKN